MNSSSLSKKIAITITSLFAVSTLAACTPTQKAATDDKKPAVANDKKDVKKPDVKKDVKKPDAKK